MAGLQLRPRDGAVVVVDAQNDLVHESRAAIRGLAGAIARSVESREVMSAAARLLGAARASGVAVVHATFENRADVPRPDVTLHRAAKGQQTLRPGTWGAEIHAAVRPAAGDVVLRRHVGVDPSVGCGLFETLVALARRQIVIIGVDTAFGVEGTVRAAVNRGFEAVVVPEACASSSDAWHRFAVEEMLPQIATVATVDEVLAAWSAR